MRTSCFRTEKWQKAVRCVNKRWNLYRIVSLTGEIYTLPKQEGRGFWNDRVCDVCECGVGPGEFLTRNRGISQHTNNKPPLIELIYQFCFSVWCVCSPLFRLYVHWFMTVNWIISVFLSNYFFSPLPLGTANKKIVESKKKRTSWFSCQWRSLE